MNFGDMKQIVAAGYDQIADRYESWASGIVSPERNRVTLLISKQASAGARVLELGCGNGEPTTRRLAGRFDVTAVDISHEQVQRARRIAPNATVIQGDMAKLDFSEHSYSAVLALFSIIHLPCEEHAAMIESIYRWLEPGGTFVFNSGTHAAFRGYDEDWLGAPMLWSQFDPEATRQMLLDTGFEIVSQRIESIDEGHGVATFIWWVARKSTGNKS